MADGDRGARVARALCVTDGHDRDEEIAVGIEGMVPVLSGIGDRHLVRGPA